MELFNLYCKLESATVIFKYQKAYLSGLTTNFFVVNGKVKEDKDIRVSVILAYEDFDKLLELLAGKDTVVKFLVEPNSTTKVRDGYVCNQYVAKSYELEQ